jgi:capsular exopolysaccharide synthesis family protein
VTVFGTIDAVPIQESEERENLEAIAARPQAPVDYQILKSNMMIHGDETGLKVFSICSPSQGEGVSTVALNLAAYLAKDNGIRVVLVDSNLRKPFLHNSLKLPASPGFAEVINQDIDVHEALKQSVIPGLFIITSGISPPRPSAIFESRKLADLIKVLRREFDWIIFDCAPVHLYPDATLLARQLDGTVLVIQAENRAAEVAIRAKEQLEEADARILGAVLNRRRLIIPEKIYQRLS